MPSPLESFLQQMLSEKAVNITIVVDNACPARPHRKRSKIQRCSLDVSDHTRGKSRWFAESSDRCESISPVPAPNHSDSPNFRLVKTPVIECDDEDEDDDGLFL